MVLLAGLVAAGCGGETPTPRQSGLGSPGLQPLDSRSGPAGSTATADRLPRVQELSLCYPVAQVPAEQQQPLYRDASLLAVTNGAPGVVAGLRKLYSPTPVLLVCDLRPSRELAVLSETEAEPSWYPPSGPAPSAADGVTASRALDLSSSAAREALVSASARQLSDTRADGLILRGLAASVPVAEDVALGAAPTAGGAREFLAALRQAQQGAVIVLEMDLADFGRVQGLLSDVDGVALRVPVGWTVKAGPKWLTGLWKGLRDAAGELARAKKHLFLVPEWLAAKPGESAASRAEATRQLAALCLLLWSERTHLLAEPEALEEAGFRPAPALGAAKGEAKEKDGLLGREFEGVRVFLNLGGKETAAPEVPGFVPVGGGQAPAQVAGFGALVLARPSAQEGEAAPSAARG